MAKYSKAHEREENSKMWRGFWHSTFGILFCWVPLLGLFLSVSGFARQVVRMTEKHRFQMAVLLLYGFLSLCVSTGAIFGGLYLYSQDQDVFLRSATSIWYHVTGQNSLPGQTFVVDHTDNLIPGLGVFEIGGGEAMPEMAALLGDDGAIDELVLPDEHFGGTEGELNLDNELLDEDEDDEDGYADGYAEADEGFEEGDDEYQQLDFGYEIVLDEETIEGELSRITYRLLVEKEDLTDEDMLDLFEDITFEDGFDLHTVSIYKTEEEAEGEFTVATMIESLPGEPPALTRK